MRFTLCSSILFILAMGGVVGVVTGESFDLLPVDRTRDACGTVDVIFNQPVDQLIANVNYGGPDLPSDVGVQIVRPGGQNLPFTVNPSGPNQSVINAIFTGQNEVYAELATCP